MPDLFCCACDEPIGEDEMRWEFLEDNDVMCDGCHV